MFGGGRLGLFFVVLVCVSYLFLPFFIGSGLFLNGTAADGVNFLGGAVNENMSVIGQKAQDISRLPAMNKHGYVAQISNTADLEDYPLP